MKQTKLIDALHTFTEVLRECSREEKLYIKLEVPYSLYMDFNYELTDRFLQYRPVAEIIKPLTLLSTTGIKVEITAKEIEDARISEKLQQCHKVLTNYYKDEK